MGVVEGGAVDDCSSLLDLLFFVFKLNWWLRRAKTKFAYGMGRRSERGAPTQSCPPRMMVSLPNCLASSLISSAARLKV